MDPKQISQRNKQRERQERGQDFQVEMRRSWHFVNNCWRKRLKDGGGGTEPGDDVILLQDFNVLAEYKRTEGHRFEMKFLRPDQVRGLLDFDRIIARNYGLVFVSFHNPKDGLDEAYAFRLIRALRYMYNRGVLYIPLDAFRRKSLPCIELPRLDDPEPTYDLRGLIECYKSL